MKRQYIWVAVSGATGKIPGKMRTYEGYFRGVFTSLKKAERFVERWMDWFHRQRFVDQPEIEMIGKIIVRKEWETKDRESYISIRRVILNPKDFEH